MSTGEKASDFIGRVVDASLRFCLNNKLIVLLVWGAVIAWGLAVTPFQVTVPWLPRDPVHVDAIPDIGENQQIVFTEWPGRSPQDVEDQVTYPLTVSLLGTPGVKTIRSVSMFGFSSIYVIFEDHVDFYWARSRLVERLNLAQQKLPEGASPALGPDATALGQIFWYTLEAREVDPRTGSVTDKPIGGWGPEELRSIQDWYVRFALQSASGVSEVASVGGFVKEYQIDVNPDAMRVYRISLEDVYQAVRRSNLDVGAQTIEINRVEYTVRGRGFLRSISDLENSVVKAVDGVPIYLKNIAHISFGPAVRRGALDVGGAEAVGGVVVVRYGQNPLRVIENVKQKVREISPGLPRKTLPDGRISQVVIVPFYDRTQLIYETLGTLEKALTEEILVTVIVVITMVMHLRSSLLISMVLPLAVLVTFIFMRLFGVDSNIMSLAGIAIAIGTVVDMGIILCENILKHLETSDPSENRLEVIFRATSEVGRPVLTALSSTVIGFLPVFTMIGPEGKLFRPLAFTKTFALIASLVVALTLIPPLAHILFTYRIRGKKLRWLAAGLVACAGLLSWRWIAPWLAVLLIGWAAWLILRELLPQRFAYGFTLLGNLGVLGAVLVVLSNRWLPLGPEKGLLINLLFAGSVIGSLLVGFRFLQVFYEPILRFFLKYKGIFYILPATSVLLGGCIWLGFERVFAPVLPLVRLAGVEEQTIRSSPWWVWAAHRFPGLGREFMPPLDEGAFLWMPTTMPHASLGECLDVLRKQDMAFAAIPEVASAVGKIGRVDSALDPAPISMIETLINYHPKYLMDPSGRIRTFRFDPNSVDYFRDPTGKPVPAPDGKPYWVRGKFLRDEKGQLIPAPTGTPFRLWRPPLDPELNPGRAPWPGINTPQDIWNLIVAAGEIPGTTSAPKLQPIAARIVMLQTGVRASIAVRITGDNLQEISEVALKVEELLRSPEAESHGVNPATVFADRVLAKPYLEIEIDRHAIARFGVRVQDVQELIEVAIGGVPITTTVEGRERYSVRIRYLRELRDSIEELERIPVPTPSGAQIHLGQLAQIRYTVGPEMLRSENARLVAYVIFDKKPGFAEVNVVEGCRRLLEEKIASGELILPPGTEKPTFIGNYENQLRAAKTLSVVIPLSLLLIFLNVYLQFRSVVTTLIIFAGVLVAMSGGFITLGLYSTDWFLNFSLFGVSMRELFQIAPVNLSIAVWVGFLALMGIADDDGVVMASYLSDSFRARKPQTVSELREATFAAGVRRIRPCLMTTATTALALLPVLTSSGRGADVMIPMAIPSVGGMLIELMTLFFVPVTYCLVEEMKLSTRRWWDHWWKSRD